MTLYQIFELVAAELLSQSHQEHQAHQDQKEKLFDYLKSTMDDNKGFTRSRYCKRQEGPVPDREVGNIEYIVCGCTKPFDIQQVRYIPAHRIPDATDFQAQIAWVKPRDDLEDTINYCKETNFGEIVIIKV